MAANFGRCCYEKCRFIIHEFAKGSLQRVHKEKFVHTSSTFKVKQEDPNNSEDIAAAENEESSNDNDTPVQQYGYEDGKRDHGTPGLLYMNTIKMPQDLKNSYVAFCRKYPKKSLTEDGQRLAKHIRNRGRPANSTVKKEKNSDNNIKTEAEEFDMDEEQNQFQSQNDEFVDKDGFALPEDELESISAEVTSQRDKKRKTKKAPNKAAYTMIRYGKRETAAFAAGRMPACFGATKRVLSEIKAREPDFHPKTLLDFGSGTGSAIWAANDIWGDTLKEYQCVDVSEDANNACQFLLKGGDEETRPLTIPGVYFRRFLPLSNKVTYDVVISAYTLSEMPYRRQRQFALSSLWGKTKDFLVLIEPGNNEGFDIALQARNYVTKGNESVKDIFTGRIEDDQGISQDEFDFIMQEEVDPGFVFAPCPHDISCPRSEVDSRDHPCNFEQRVELAFSQRNTTLRRWGYATERFSYLVLRKGERDVQESSNSRVLHPPKRKKRHVICDICTGSGNIERHIFTKKKDPMLYKGVRHCLKWGDLMPPLENRKPNKIITFEKEESDEENSERST